MMDNLAEYHMLAGKRQDTLITIYTESLCNTALIAIEDKIINVEGGSLPIYGLLATYLRAAAANVSLDILMGNFLGQQKCLHIHVPGWTLCKFCLALFLWACQAKMPKKKLLQPNPWIKAGSHLLLALPVVMSLCLQHRGFTGYVC